MAGELIPQRDGFGFDPDGGSFFITNANGNCENCCEGVCELWWCGCGPLINDMTNIRQMYNGASSPIKMRIPEFFTFGGACGRNHIHSHALSWNIGDELEDVKTLIKFNCDGDGTGTFLVQTLVYDGNNPDIVPNSQWRFGGYISMKDRLWRQSSSGWPVANYESSWPLLENKPTYNESTSRLSVLVRWADYLHNDTFKMYVSPAEDMKGQGPYDPNATITFVSWSGTGTATFNPTGGPLGNGELVVTDNPNGVAEGTAIFEVSNPLHNSYAVLVIEDYEGAHNSYLSAYCFKDYPHTIAGGDTEGITFDARNMRCGMCDEGSEIEIDFDTTVAQFTALILPKKGSQESINTGGSLGDDFWLNEYWCGCGSEPWNHTVPTSFAGVTESTINGFWVVTADEDGGRYATPHRPSLEYQHHKVNSNYGGQYGWQSRNNEIYRFIERAEDSDGRTLEKYNHMDFNWNPGDPSHDVKRITGWSVIPLVPHEYHDNPYVDGRTNAGALEYNSRTNSRLGVFQPLAAPFNTWPDEETYSYLNYSRVEVEFDFKLHWIGNRYWQQFIPDQDLLDGIDSSFYIGHTAQVKIQHVGPYRLDEDGIWLNFHAAYENGGSWRDGSKPIMVVYPFYTHYPIRFEVPHDEFANIKYVAEYKNQTTSETLYINGNSLVLEKTALQSFMRNFYYYKCGGMSIAIVDVPYRQKFTFQGDGPLNEGVPFKARPTCRLKNLRIEYFDSE